MNKYGCVFFLLIFLFACSDNKRVEKALLLAGKNRPELEKVLNRYKGDDLKYKATCFLIENMIYHSYREGEWMDGYRKYFEYMENREYTPSEVIEKIEKEEGGLSGKKWIYKKDIEEVDSAYLTANIEWAFKVWQEQPWGKNIDFEQFCEMILPYRLGDESLSLWREDAYNTYNSLLDDFRRTSDAEDYFKAAQVMIDSLQNMDIWFTTELPSGPHVGPELLKWKVGTCRELSAILIYILRAVGIPCGMDYFSFYRIWNVGHSWTYLPDMEGNFYECNFPTPHVQHSSYMTWPKAKVFRMRFSLNREMSEQLGGKKEFIHPFFRYPLFDDVTGLYGEGPFHNIIIPEYELNDKIMKDEVVYLCLSNFNNWIAMEGSKPVKGTIQFDTIEGDAVFTVGVWRNNRLEIISDPFHLDYHTGSVRFFKPGSETQDMTVFTKYIYLDNYAGRMLDGVFEGSNTPDFAVRDTLFYVSEKPYRVYNTAYTGSSKKYRYVRYYGAPESNCNIGEAAFYASASDTVPLKGTIIGTPGCYIGDGSRDYTKVFDGDPYTAFDYKDRSGGWSGLDLGKPCTVEKIIYVPRLQDNFVQAGDRYDLFYFKDGNWNSAGQQMAAADSLHYTVPSGALYYLKNYSRGIDERIFEYQNGRQIFW